MSNFVSATDVHEALHQGRGYSILASMWEKGPQGGLRRYLSEHIPTALYCDPQAALAGLPSSQFGRNPLPDPDQVVEAARKWGLRAQRPVIVYDQANGLLAARTWWILRWAGIQNVRIMAGGLKKWDEHGFEIVGGPGNFAYEANVIIEPGQMPVSTIEEVKEHDGLLIDVRQPNRFAGRKENLDLKAGHIPGAINVPVADLLNEAFTPRTPEEVRQRFEQAGITDTSNAIIYSGSGNHSALALAIMEDAGLTGVSHFVGGWSQWSADVKNSVERGG